MEHEIKTLKDILSVVNQDNIDLFMTDFKNWINFSMNIDNWNKTMKNDSEVVKIYPDTFTWIDDGKNEIHIHVEVEKK